MDDAYKQMEEVDEFLYKVLTLAYEQQRHIGILFVESFRSCFKTPWECDRHCRATRQGFLQSNFTGVWTDAIQSNCTVAQYSPDAMAARPTVERLLSIKQADAPLVCFLPSGQS